MTVELIFPVTTASLGASLALVIAISTMIIVKLQKDKRRLVRSVAVHSSVTIDRLTNQQYENIELCDQLQAATAVTTSTVDHHIEINENPAYSTVHVNL